MANVVSIATGTGQLGTTAITAGTGISVTPGANTITIATGSAVADSFVTGSGTATPSSGVLTVSGTANQISTSGAGSTVTIAVPSSPSFGGTTTVATGLTATSGAITATAGNVVITAGNLTLPATSSTVGQITLNGSDFLHGFGTQNIFAGTGAGNFTLTSTNCVGIGFDCLNALSSGLYNTAVGDSAGLALTTGQQNCLFGNGVAYQLVSGSYNLIAGPNTAGFGYSGSESSNIVFSNEGVPGESHVIRIGTSGSGAGQQNLCYIAGIFGVTVGVSGTAVFIDNTGNLGTVVSSQRFKENITDLAPTPVLDLKPVSFNYKSDKTKTKQYGLIAEEVEKVFPDLVSYDDEGLPHSVKYHELPVLLLAEIKKLSARIHQLERLLEEE